MDNLIFLMSDSRPTIRRLLRLVFALPVLAAPLVVQSMTVAEGAPLLPSTYVHSTTVTLGLNNSSVEAMCNPGDFATGGGFNFSGGLKAVRQSRPEPTSGTPTSWHVDIGIGLGGTVTVFVVCMTPAAIGGVTTRTTVVEADKVWSFPDFTAGGATGTCAGVDVATGGGFESDGGSRFILRSEPSPLTGTPNGWHGFWGVDVLGAGETAKVFAVCMTPVSAGGAAASIATVSASATLGITPGGVSASCAAGDFATGGGFDFVSFSPLSDKAVLVGEPIPTNGMPPTGWSMRESDSIPPLFGGTATAFAICLNDPQVPPTLTASAKTADGAPYAGGTWTNQDVTVTFTCVSAGVAVTPTPASVTLSGEGKDQSATSTCTDSFGATATATFANIDIDKTPPTISATATVAGGGVYTAGTWTNQTVTVSFSCTDALSGVAPGSITAPVLVTTDGDHSVAGSCRDVAGNVASTTFDVKVDRTPPTISAAATVAGGGAYTAGIWTNRAVTVTFICTDATSGVAPGSVTPPVTLATDGDNQAVTGTCKDVAGNQASATFSNIRIDRTPPIVTWTVNLTPYACSGISCTQTVSFALNQLVSISCGSTDALSGVVLDGCASAGMPFTGFCGSTFASGMQFVAISQDLAGNITDSTLTVNCAGTFPSLRALTLQWVTNKRVAAALVVKLDRAAAAFARGNFHAADGLLQAYRNQLHSQIGKSITAAHAAVLTQASLALGGPPFCTGTPKNDCDRESGGGDRQQAELADHGVSGAGKRRRSGSMSE